MHKQQYGNKPYKNHMQRNAMMEKEFNIYISNENIQNVNIQKLLGIYLDHNLDWKNQIDYICKNINSRLFLLAKIKKSILIKNVKLYFSILIFFQSLTSVVLYGGIVVKKEFNELQNYKKSSENNSRCSIFHSYSYLTV